MTKKIIGLLVAIAIAGVSVYFLKDVLIQKNNPTEPTKQEETTNKDNKTDNKVTEVKTDELVKDNEENEGKNPASIEQSFNEKLINPAKPLSYDYVVVFDQACRDAKDESCNLELINQILWTQFQQPPEKIAYVNNKHPEIEQIKKSLDLTQGSPILFISKKAVAKMKETITKLMNHEQFKEIEEAQKEFKNTLKNIDEQFPAGKDTNGFYSLSLANWIIDKKNVCDKENDWESYDTCAVAYYVYDKNCPKEQEFACGDEVQKETKNRIGKRFFFKALEKDSAEAKEYLQYNKNWTYPFMVLKFKKSNVPNYFVEILKSRDELQEVKENTYYALPEYLKTEWKDDSKICTLDKELAKDTTKYVSCSDKSCSWKEMCVVEEKESIDIYVMGYCPYCKGVVAKLADFKKANPKAKINLVHLLQPKTKTPTSLNDLSSLHGDKETVENARQYCIQKEFGEDRLFDYFKNRFANPSVSDESNLEDTYKKINFNKDDISKVNTCINLPLTSQELANRAVEAFSKNIQWTPSYIVNKKHLIMWGYEQMVDGYKKYNK